MDITRSDQKLRLGKIIKKKGTKYTEHGICHKHNTYKISIIQPIIKPQVTKLELY